MFFKRGCYRWHCHVLDFPRILSFVKSGNKFLKEYEDMTLHALEATVLHLMQLGCIAFPCKACLSYQYKTMIYNDNVWYDFNHCWNRFFVQIQAWFLRKQACQSWLHAVTMLISSTLVQVGPQVKEIGAPVTVGTWLQSILGCGKSPARHFQPQKWATPQNRGCPTHQPRIVLHCSASASCTGYTTIDCKLCYCSKPRDNMRFNYELP